MNIYVGNLSFQTEEEEVQTLFEKYGTVNSVKVIRDNETGRSKGFCFVEMENDAQANEAISELDGYSLDNRSLKINEARPRPAGGSSGGGYGGGGGSRGGGGYSGGGGGNKRW